MRKRSHVKEPVFGLVLGGVKQNVVVSPSVAESVMASPNASSTAITDYITENVFGDRGTMRRLKPSELSDFHDAVTPNEAFAIDALAREIHLIQRETPNLVSFCRSPVDQAQWERGSQVKLIENANSPTCEANLFSLMRDFTAHIAISVFMGQAFIDSSFAGIGDLWTMDDRFLSLLTGVPRWFPSPGVSAAHPARLRLLDALAVYHQSIVDELDSRDSDAVSEHIRNLVLVSERLGLSLDASAAAHMSQLWGLLRETPKVVFWNLIRIFSNSKLLEHIREEIAPYAKASRATLQETGFPIPAPPKLAIDLEGLQKSCPLLKACYYETLRFYSAGISFRQLTSDLDLAESDSDAARDGLKKPREYILKQGDYVAVSHGAYHRNACYFENPTKYDYHRFIKTDCETGEKSVDTGAFTPSCDGVFEVKGQSFAESEILAFTAAVLSLWDLSPAGVDVWKIPGQRATIGMLLPSTDVRVRMKLKV